MKYSINLVRTTRQQEKKTELRRLNTSLFAVFSFGVLGVAILFTVFQMLEMRLTIENEILQLERIKVEYKKYKETRMIVDKADIELLDSLQNNRIFWTKKLAAMAFHLPDNYWVTQFGYKPSTFNAQGYGYITLQQEQLVTIDDYLNQLRADTTYNDVFKRTFFNSTARTDEGFRSRVSFEYSSMR
jgi:hypothetical protein